MTDDGLIVAKKNARILMLGDNRFVLYTWDPVTTARNKYTFDDYESAQAKAAEFMGFNPTK